MKLKTILLTAALTASLSLTTFAQGVTVSLDGSLVSFPNQQPTVVEGRTLIPLRGVFDNMGYTIGWNGSTKTVTLTKGSDSIVINIGESCYYLNGKAVAIDVPAQIINGSTMLPLRAIADATGATVLWDNDTKIATIVTENSKTAKVSQGSVTVLTQQESDYIDGYTAIFNDYNPVALEFTAFFQKINSSGLQNEADLAEMRNVSEKMYNGSVNAKNKLAALNCPSKFSKLNKVTIEYADSMSELAKLFVDLADNKLTLDQFNQKLQSIGTAALQKEAEYQKVFNETID